VRRTVCNGGSESAAAIPGDDGTRPAIWPKVRHQESGERRVLVEVLLTDASFGGRVFVWPDRAVATATVAEPSATVALKTPSRLSARLRDLPCVTNSAIVTTLLRRMRLAL
jgi:hypothetical protein